MFCQKTGFKTKPRQRNINFLKNLFLRRGLGLKPKPRFNTCIDPWWLLYGSFLALWGMQTFWTRMNTSALRLALRQKRSSGISLVPHAFPYA